MNRIKIWPHVTVAILCAVISGAAAALWVRHQRAAETQIPLAAARMQRVDGEVALKRSVDNDDTQWIEATPNTPVSAGDRIYARDHSRATIAFTGRNFARLNEHASLDVLSLDHGTQVALRDGSAIFNVGALAPGEQFEVATPYGAVDLDQPGLYQVGFNDQGGAAVSVLSGLAQVVGLGGTGQINKGEMLTLLGATAAEVALSRLDPAYAGNLIDDYYSYQYPRIYDGRYRDYNVYLSDPYYYDPYNRYVSYQYVTDVIPGVYDLDDYGDWRDVSGYGYVWHPRVDTNWAPYQQGYWSIDDPYGLTWVSNEPWGYAPYHYGRWVYVDNQWFWIPERLNTRPAYSPALVAFIPLVDENVVGWVPLGPGDPYAPRYYDADWQPHYLTQTGAVQGSIVNLRVPGAVTTVTLQDFNRVITRNIITRVNQQKLAQARPVLDPFAVDRLRQAAVQTAAARRRIQMPQAVVERIDNTRVITSRTPVAPPFRKDLAQALRVESVPEKQRKEKLQFKDERQPAVAQQQQPDESRRSTADQGGVPPGVDQERNEKIAKLSAEAARGDKAARRQVQQLKREQHQEERAQQSSVRQEAVAQQRGNAAAQVENERGQQRAQGERVSQRLQDRGPTERQQAITAQQQRRDAIKERIEARQQERHQQASTMRAKQGPVQKAQQNRARPEQPAENRAPRAQGRLQPQRERPAAAAAQQAIERKQGPKAKAEKPAGKGKGRP
jgi:hypothetical protein